MVMKLVSVCVRLTHASLIDSSRSTKAQAGTGRPVDSCSSTRRDAWNTRLGQAEVRVNTVRVNTVRVSTVQQSVRVTAAAGSEPCGGTAAPAR